MNTRHMISLGKGMRYIEWRGDWNIRGSVYPYNTYKETPCYVLGII